MEHQVNIINQILKIHVYPRTTKTLTRGPEATSINLEFSSNDYIIPLIRGKYPLFPWWELHGSSFEET